MNKKPFDGTTVTKQTDEEVRFTLFNCNNYVVMAELVAAYSLEAKVAELTVLYTAEYEVRFPADFKGNASRVPTLPGDQPELPEYLKLYPWKK